MEDGVPIYETGNGDGSHRRKNPKWKYSLEKKDPPPDIELPPVMGSGDDDEDEDDSEL